MHEERGFVLTVMPAPLPDPLHPLLDRWGEAPRVRGVALDVRRRLAGVENRRGPRPGELVLLRPAFAAVFLAACVLLGLFLAELRVSQLHRERDAQLLESYRRLIDPLLTAAPFPAATGAGHRT